MYTKLILYWLETRDKPAIEAGTLYTKYKIKNVRLTIVLRPSLILSKIEKPHDFDFRHSVIYFPGSIALEQPLHYIHKVT